MSEYQYYEFAAIDGPISDALTVAARLSQVSTPERIPMAAALEKLSAPEMRAFLARVADGGGAGVMAELNRLTYPRMQIPVGQAISCVDFAEKTSETREARLKKAAAAAAAKRQREAELRKQHLARVGQHLLNKHPELKPEAEELATQVISAASIEDVAEEIYLEITSIDLEALNGRAGSHSWGYVEPSEAAAELLTEAVERRVEEMKRSLELGLLAPAEALCVGIVQGLNRARNVESDGALGWAVDFPAEEAGFVVEEYLKGCRPSSREAAPANLMQALTERAPEWAAGLGRAAERAARDPG